MKNEYVRQSVGSKKLAPVNMRKNEYQFVIDAYLVEDVLKQIPVGVRIIQSQIMVYTQSKRSKIVVPVVLKKKGVSSMRDIGMAREVIFMFDELNKEIILKNVKHVCKENKFQIEKAFFRYIVFANNEATAKFEHCTKEQRPDETDLRKKLRVLGCTSGTGKVQGLISQLNATKFHCSIKEEVIKMVMCTKE